MGPLIAVTFLLSLRLICVTGDAIVPELFSIRLEHHVQSNNLDGAFRLFSEQFRKSYSSLEEAAKRNRIFVDNLNYISANNRLFAEGKRSYELKINRMADMSVAEMAAYSGHSNAPHRSSRKSSGFYEPRGVPPDFMDLRQKNVVTPVVDQGRCAACWAFSAIAALETATAIHTRRLTALSPQHLLDCSGEPDGCTIGSMRGAYDFIQENGGIAASVDYPYTKRQEACKQPPKVPGTEVKSYAVIRQEADIKNAVAHGNAISVALNGSARSFAFYSRGVLDNEDCNSTSLTHGGAVIGYGTEDGKDYWLLKNSWGVQWGMQGFVKIVQNKNMCGLAVDMAFPIVGKTE